MTSLDENLEDNDQTSIKDETEKLEIDLTAGYQTEADQEAKELADEETLEVTEETKEGKVEAKNVSQ